MWEYAGIIRNIKNIEEVALPKITAIKTALNKFTTTNQALTETLNMAQVSELILKAAAKRTKSLGCHFIAKDAA
jgi:aspartate oxidase